MKNRYLEIKFHDNDFGHCFQEALKRIYNYIHDNNHHLLETDQTLVALFLELADQGILFEMIKKACVLEHLYNNIEFATRGLYRGKVSWAIDNLRRVVQIGEDFSRYDDYFNFEIEFHDTTDFSKEWRNGEHYGLDIATGYIWSF